MKRLWLRWVGLFVFVAVLVVVFVNLGQWQLRRLDERKQRNAMITAHASEPIADFPRYCEHPITESDQWHRVRAVGQFDHSNEIIVRYRNLSGKQGFEVITPLLTDQGKILVDRGFQELRGGSEPRAVPAPGGTVTVIGYTRRDEHGPQHALTPVDKQVRLINSSSIGASINASLVEGYLALISVAPSQDSALQPLPVPTLDEGPHLSYALQWFAFTVLAGVGLFVFIRGDLRERKRKRSLAAYDSSTDMGKDQPDSVLSSAKE